MSLAITHFALGAGLTTIVLSFFFTRTGYPRTITVVGGLWALIPDLHYISPIYNEPLRAIKQSIFGNIFWFHAYMDAIEPGRGTRAIAAVMVTFLLVATIVAEVHDTRSGGHFTNLLRKWKQ